jgi:hypothetical protein
VAVFSQVATDLESDFGLDHYIVFSTQANQRNPGGFARRKTSGVGLLKLDVLSPVLTR